MEKKVSYYSLTNVDAMDAHVGDYDVRVFNGDHAHFSIKHVDVI